MSYGKCPVACSQCAVTTARETRHDQVKLDGILKFEGAFPVRLPPTWTRKGPPSPRQTHMARHLALCKCLEEIGRHHSRSSGLVVG